MIINNTTPPMTIPRTVPYEILLELEFEIFEDLEVDFSEVIKIVVDEIELELVGFVFEIDWDAVVAVDVGFEVDDEGIDGRVVEVWDVVEVVVEVVVGAFEVDVVGVVVVGQFSVA